MSVALLFLESPNHPMLCWWPLEIVDLLLHMAYYHTETMKALCCSILYYFYLILKLQSIGFVYVQDRTGRHYMAIATIELLDMKEAWSDPFQLLDMKKACGVTIPRLSDACLITGYQILVISLKGMSITVCISNSSRNVFIFH